MIRRLCWQGDDSGVMTRGAMLAPEQWCSSDVDVAVGLVAWSVRCGASSGSGIAQFRVLNVD